jgi:hypothetical protein
MWQLFIDRFATVHRNPQEPGTLSEDQEVYLTARAFMVACSILVAKFSHDEKTMPIVPMITNLAFATELFLKSLIMKDGGPVPMGREGHDISRLYRLLTSDQKDSIMGILEQKMKPMEREFLEEKISSVHKVFVEWRYVYEKNERKKIDIELITNLALVLDEICAKQNKS